MQLKRTIMSYLILLALTLFGWAWTPSPAFAQECGGDCSVVPTNCHPICIEGECHESCDYVSNCGGNGCQNVSCPSGQYYASDGCHEIGDGGGQTGGDGGGAYGYPTCGGSQVLKCGNDPVLYLGGGGGDTNDANLASCAYRGTCGDSYFPFYIHPILSSFLFLHPVVKSPQ
jgi:hypothetical protein